VSPLSGVRILDLTRLLPGPLATLRLADLGAEVIRIAPLEGDLDPARIHCDTPILRLDLARPEGRDEFLRLAKDAGVIVEGFRPGVVDRLGIGYEAVRAINPRIVYCSISGYGQTGPDRLRAGHDINYVAAAGLATPPVLPGLPMGDLLGGSLTAVTHILAALLEVRARGAGCYIDVSMTDTLRSYACALSGIGDILTGGVPCYNHYRTRDGRYLAVGALEAKFWKRLCDTIGRPDLESLGMARGEEGRRVREALDGIFAAQDSDHWLRVFRNVDCCVNLVLTRDEALSRLP
jgi:crotonobetainyl-CoA:carnitine CoA-transferase CaiB-like acyl-CoA transferase